MATELSLSGGIDIGCFPKNSDGSTEVPASVSPLFRESGTCSPNGTLGAEGRYQDGDRQHRLVLKTLIGPNSIPQVPTGLPPSYLDFRIFGELNIAGPLFFRIPWLMLQLTAIF